jgi:hypothetical protein
MATAEEDARKAAADSLRRQLEDLKAGKAPKKPATSLRELFDEKMAEDARERREEQGETEQS